MKKFIKIYDKWGTCFVLNTANIICVRRHVSHIVDEDFDGVKSVVQYGSGFMDEIYMSVDVQDFYKEFLSETN